MDVGRRNLFAVYVSHLAGATSLAMFVPFLPYYLGEIGVEGVNGQRWWAGVIIGTTPLIASVAGPLWGALGDRIGRRWMVLRGLASVTVFITLMGFATSPWHLWALAICQGLFAGFIAAGNTLVSVSTPIDRQGRTLGVLQTALLLGIAIGPLLGGVLGDAIGHRAVFFVAGALAGAALVIVACVVREEGLPRPPGEERRGGIVEGVLRDVGRELANGRLRALLGSLACFRMSIAMMLPILPLYLLELDGFDPARRSTTAGMLFFAGALPVLFCVSWWGRAADRLGAGVVFLVSATLGAALYIPYGFVGTVTALMLLRAAQGIVLAGPMPAAYAALSVISPIERRGAALGLSQSALQLAMAIGPLAAAGLAVVLDIRWIFALAGGVLLFGVALARFGWMVAPRADGNVAKGPVS